MADGFAFDKRQWLWVPAFAGTTHNMVRWQIRISNSHDDSVAGPSLRANGSRECAPDDRLREAIHGATRKQEWIASSLRSSQ
jgi:hypothetical protein